MTTVPGHDAHWRFPPTPGFSAGVGSWWSSRGTRIPLEEFPVVRVLDTGEPIANLVVGVLSPTAEETSQ